MPLGNQFKNTYWEDPTSGKTMASSRLKDEQPVPLINELSSAEEHGMSKNAQGMLFEPYAYTGLKKDSTVSREQRLGAINKALRLEPSEEKPKTSDVSPRIRRRSKTDSVKVQNLKKDALRDAADSLDIPTHEYEQTINAPTRPTSWNKGEAEYSGRITAGVRPKREKTVTEVTAHQPSTTSLPNTKFWEQYEKKVRHPGDVHSVLWEKDVHWTDPSGKVIKNKDLESQELYDSAAIEYLKENKFVPNVYPGSGKATSTEAVGREVKIESGYHPRGSGYTYQTWHTKYAPDTTAPTTTKRVVKKKNLGYEANAPTLAHEIGHTTEPQVLDSYRTMHTKGSASVDPVSEGYADALADRASRYADQFEDQLTNVPKRAKDIKTTGYTSSYHMWNAPERALYSAVRYHLAANPRDTDKLTTREGLMKQYGRPNDRNQFNETDLAQKLMLGHMYETQPHVRPVLDELGFSKTAKEAHEEFMSRGTRPSSNRPWENRGFRKTEQGKQGRLF